MTRVQMLEREVRQLDPMALAAFRDWFRKYDSDAWDRQIKKDIRSGKLRKFAERAIAEYRAGKTKEL
jgi:hypothetical protein